MKFKAPKNLIFKTTLLLVLSSTALISCGAQKDSKVEVKFWSADTYYKIVSDRGFDYYSSIATDAALKYRMGQGEYESAQIIMTPNGDVKSYDVKISDIKDNSGNNIENVSVYAQKYIKVEGVYDSATGETPGYFPDAILPFEASKNYGENKITKGYNQAIYVSVESSLNQKPGIYSGQITVTISGEDNNFPVEVEVLPVLINETTHSNSIFLNHWNYQFQELNGSQEMMDKYTEACIKYRLGTDRIVIDHNNCDLNMDYYVDKAYEYMQNPRYPTCVIPYKQVYDEKLQITTFDTNVLKDYIYAYFDKSCDTGFNMFAKSRLYLGLIDEPEETEKIPYAIQIMDLYKKTIKSIADELQGYRKSDKMHDELVASVYNLQNVVTNKYNSDLESYVDTWCPKVDEYNRAYDREKYDNQKEKWWYTCVHPRAPYPTYHTEDSVSSAKLLSWMQANYGVSGNLYWATNNYAKWENNVFQPIENVYEQADFADNINGDGYLFYPGGQYGLSDPVASIRLEAIRDGLEEYEIFYNLEKQYKALGANYSSLFKMITPSLYYGTKVHAYANQTRTARNELLNLVLANGNGSDFLIYDYENVNGKVDLVFYAKNGTTIKIDGQAVSPFSQISDGKLYTVSKNLKQINNLMTFEISYADSTTSFTHDFGGSVSTKGASTVKNGFKKYNSSVTPSVVNGSEVLAELTYDIVRLEISAPKEAKQSIKYEPSYLSEISSNTFGVTFEVINPTANNVEFSIGGKFSNRPSDFYLVENEMLKPGMNRIFVPFNNFAWSNYGALTYLMFVFGNNTSTTEDAKTMYFGNVSIINK